MPRQSEANFLTYQPVALNISATIAKPDFSYLPVCKNLDPGIAGRNRIHQISAPDSVTLHQPDDDFEVQ